MGVMLSGCAMMSVPPEVSPGSLPLATAPHWKVPVNILLSKRIFEVKQHAEMQQYLRQVLNNNPDLKSIAITAKAANRGVDIARAEALPDVGLNLSGMRSKDDLTKEVANIVSVGADINWALDVWGQLSDEAAAAQHSSDQAQFDLLQAKRVLLSQSALAWVEHRGYIHNENHLTDLNMTQTQLLDHYQEAYQAGLSPYELFLDAKNSQGRSQVQLQEIQHERLKTQHLMNILRGRFPADAVVVTDDTISLKMVAFTEEIPATALVNRPDIQAAFSQVLAFGRSARAAHKALLPQINLTGSALKSGASLEKALRGDLIWELIGGITQPLFNGGQLKAVARQKSAEAEASWWQYQNTVFKAMLEVEDALVSDNMLARQLEQKHVALNNLKQKTDSAEERFSDGDLSLADYLQTQVERIETQIELTQIEVLYIKNRLALVLALGLPMEISQEDDNEKS